MDIVLTVIDCAIQLTLGLMGVYVALKPPHEKKHRYWIGGFIVVGLLGVVLTGWLARRAGRAQDSAIEKISNLESKLSHAHIRMEITSVAVLDASKFPRPMKLDDFLSVTRKAMFNITYRNVGTASSFHSAGLGNVIIASSVPNFDVEFSKLDARFKNGWTGGELVPQESKFFTAESRMLSSEDINRIKDGKLLGIYVFGIVKFSDSTGDYEQELCSFLQPPATTNIWHDCEVHAGETKLK